VKVALLDDYLDTLRTLTRLAALAGHNVTVWRDHTDDDGVLADHHVAAEVLVPICERTRLTAALLARLPALGLISRDDHSLELAEACIWPGHPQSAVSTHTPFGRTARSGPLGIGTYASGRSVR